VYLLSLVDDDNEALQESCMALIPLLLSNSETGKKLTKMKLISNVIGHFHKNKNMDEAISEIIKVVSSQKLLNVVDCDDDEKMIIEEEKFRLKKMSLDTNIDMKTREKLVNITS